MKLNLKKTEESPTSSRISQSEIPRVALAKAIAVGRVVQESFGGKPTTPHQVAIALDTSPASSTWRVLCGASIAFGLTDGGYNADKIALTDLGRRAVAPTAEGVAEEALLEAALRPKHLRTFFERFDRAKFPADKILKNILLEQGVPPERIDEAVLVILESGEFARIIQDTKTGRFVSLDRGLHVPSSGTASKVDANETSIGTVVTHPSSNPGNNALPNRVFITHGKNGEIVKQLRQLLAFGKLTPVVAEDHETTSKPVPDKVLDDMRSCFAGIIHVESEQQILDSEGLTRHHLNENVLIEIGAALALYGRNVILLVQRGVSLPSNLQGLYRCEYVGDKLDGDATMKMLSACSEFK